MGSAFRERLARRRATPPIGTRPTAAGRGRGNPCGSPRISDLGDTRPDPLSFRPACAQALLSAHGDQLSGARNSPSRCERLRRVDLTCPQATGARPFRAAKPIMDLPFAPLQSIYPRLFVEPRGRALPPTLRHTVPTAQRHVFSQTRRFTIRVTNAVAKRGVNRFRRGTATKPATIMPAMKTSNDRWRRSSTACGKGRWRMAASSKYSRPSR